MCCDEDATALMATLRGLTILRLVGGFLEMTVTLCIGLRSKDVRGFTRGFRECELFVIALTRNKFTPHMGTVIVDDELTEMGRNVDDREKISV